MKTDSTGDDWDSLLNTLSAPAAVLDRDGRFVYLNEAMMQDVRPPVETGGKSKWTDADFVGRFALVSETRKAVLFSDEHKLWVMLPVLDLPGGLREVLLIGFDGGTWRDGVEASARAEVWDRISGSVRTPLTAIAGLAGSIQNLLEGAGRDQAELIERNTRLVLREIESLNG